MTKKTTFKYDNIFFWKAVFIVIPAFLALSLNSCKQTLHDEIISDNSSAVRTYSDNIIEKSSSFHDQDGDGRCDADDPFPDKFNVFYDRQAVREYAAEYANSVEDTDRYAYLSGGITDCANFVSQCIRAGGYDMTDEWYMHRYSDDVSWLRKKSDRFSGMLDKAVVLAQNDIFNRVAGIMGKEENIPVTETVGWLRHTYSDGISSIQIDKIQPQNVKDDFIWSNAWSSAEWQTAYGRDHFFSDNKCIEIPAASKDDIKKNVENVVLNIQKNNVQTGDIVYLGIKETICHVMIITNITDDGKVYLSAHSVGVNEKLFDEKLWCSESFSDVTLYKVNDVIK